MRRAASAQPHGEPSWPRVLATTIRLWLERRRLRRSRRGVLAALLLLALAAGSGVLLAQRSPGGAAPRSRAVRAGGPAAAAGEAAGWVAAQVSRSVRVSCDPAMCSALRRHGFPAGNLVMARSHASGPPDSGLIVVTAALRSEMGSLLAASAPVVIASFGTGSARTEVRATATDGAAYLRQFRADAAARKSVGAELLRNPAVQADQAARQQLSAGLADPRLIATIGIMAVLHPVHLVSFGDPSPGASAGVPLRSAVLDGVTHGVTAGTAFLGSLRALLLAQRPPYRPAGIRTVRLAAGQSALRIWFAAPAPLGLLNERQPLVKISPP